MAIYRGGMFLMSKVLIPAKIYRGYDADLTKAYPADGYLGWEKREFKIDPEKTAVLVMHAWNCGTPEEYPGVFRSNEYVTRSYEICKNKFPAFLDTVRKSPLKLIHIVGGGDYYISYPGYKNVQKILEEYNIKNGITGKEVKDTCQQDEISRKIKEIITYDAAYGRHNMEDINKSRKIRNFADQAFPQGDEPVAETTEELFAYCKKEGINHLIYSGFALNACLQISPCGMVDMFRKGFLCSVAEDLTVALETKESIRTEGNKHAQLYMISTIYGLVFESDDIINVFN